MNQVIVNGIRKRLRASVAVLRSGHGGHDPPVRTVVPLRPPNETGCKVTQYLHSQRGIA